MKKIKKSKIKADKNTMINRAILFFIVAFQVFGGEFANIRECRFQGLPLDIDNRNKLGNCLIDETGQFQRYFSRKLLKGESPNYIVEVCGKELKKWGDEKGSLECPHSVREELYKKHKNVQIEITKDKAVLIDLEKIDFKKPYKDTFDRMGPQKMQLGDYSKLELHEILQCGKAFRKLAKFSVRVVDTPDNISFATQFGKTLFAFNTGRDLVVMDFESEFPKFDKISFSESKTNRMMIRALREDGTYEIDTLSAGKENDGIHFRDYEDHSCHSDSNKPSKLTVQPKQRDQKEMASLFASGAMRIAGVLTDHLNERNIKKIKLAPLKECSEAIRKKYKTDTSSVPTQGIDRLIRKIAALSSPEGENKGRANASVR